LTADGTVPKRRGDSVWCGAVACVLILAMDAIALARGGRAEVPAGALWIAVAGLLLPVLNVYFVIKDVVARRARDAGLGLALSLLALFMAFDPPWGAFIGLGGRPPTGGRERRLGMRQNIPLRMVDVGART
jgi:hypothetical protein